MFLTSKKALGLSIFLALSLIKPGLAQEPSEAPDAFVKRYFQTLHTAKSLEDLRPFYPVSTAKEEAEYKDAPADMKKMIEQLALGMCKQEPRTVKIVSKENKNGKIYFELAPDEIPTEFKKQSTDSRFSMKGSVALISEGGQWKVYKDHWKVKAYDSGEMKISFGRDPDKEDAEPKSESSRSVDSEYSDQIRDLFTKDWSAKTKGAVQTTFKITDGTLSEIIIESKGNNKEQADFIRSLLTSAKSIPVLPKEMEETPYVWVQIEWNTDAYCINGPFFRSEPQKITW